MAAKDGLKNEYDAQAADYEKLYTIAAPFLRLDTELFTSALGHPTCAVILDLGGGSGIRARQALDAGAKAVDVVDFSPEMMRQGQEIEAKLNRDMIRWFEADVSKPLDHLPLRPEYDMIIAGWVFDHAESIDMLEGMWRNVAAYLKPGGRFINIRCGDPRAPALVKGELGVIFKDFEEIPGGLRYRYSVNSLPIDIEATSMETSYSGSTEMHEKYGLVDVRIEPYEKTEVVKEDPKLWKSFLEHPGLAVVTATKKL
ncbi:S-adenosyl-L-methionine-dependent methyltransferase [Xylariaceae sp. AK1471]|nr:S-adenosyl-L-methionine-dependent methyltransferase [Xylariaceae sp. AK1471]